MAVEEEWLAHEAGVSALVPSRSRVFSMAADGSIRAWCSTLPCPDEQAARSASHNHLHPLLQSDIMAGAPVHTRQGDMHSHNILRDMWVVISIGLAKANRIYRVRKFTGGDTVKLDSAAPNFSAHLQRVEFCRDIQGAIVCRRTYADEAGKLVERHMLEVFCLTWNVNEARPEGGNALHRWVVDLSRDAGLLVVALQEIESGGSSLAMAAAKDALLARQQVTPHAILAHMACRLLCLSCHHFEADVEQLHLASCCYRVRAGLMKCCAYQSRVRWWPLARSDGPEVDHYAH